MGFTGRIHKIVSLKLVKNTILKLEVTPMFNKLKRRNTKLVMIRRSIYHPFIILLLIFSMFSDADTIKDWNIDQGAITLIQNDSSENQWAIAQTTIIPIDDKMLFTFYLYPKDEYETCKFDLGPEGKGTAILINGEVISADASCYQQKDGTYYAIFISSPTYLDKVVQVFKESATVKIEHDIIAFNSSAMGFNKVWNAKAAAYKSPVTLDLLDSYNKLAKDGDIEMQFFLGLCHLRGDSNCPLDYHVAFKWMESAALQGHKEAQMTLGKMYAGGDGVARDINLSAKWYRKAAEQGQAAAQFYLANYYFQGNGVIKDEVTAHMWYNVSAANGYNKAKKPLELMEQFMSRQQLEKAYNLARQCVNNNFKRCGM